MNARLVRKSKASNKLFAFPVHGIQGTAKIPDVKRNELCDIQEFNGSQGKRWLTRPTSTIREYGNRSAHIRLHGDVSTRQG